MNAVYRAIAGRIRREVHALSQVVVRTLHAWGKAGSASDDYYVDAAALNLHGFYAGLERLFEVIADGVDRAKPSGPRWHQDLLFQMTAEISGVRPAVLSAGLRDKLDRYRGFRHVVRNVYTFSLDPEQIGVLVRQLDPTWEQASQELLAFAAFLEQIAGEE